MPEVWRTIEYPGYDRYEVSNRGRIRSKTVKKMTQVGYEQTFHGRILKPRVNNIEPHLFVELRNTDEDGKTIRRTVYVHKCVMEHFGKPHPKTDDVWYVEHIDMNYENNHIANLRWITHKDMVKRNKALGLLKPNYELYKHSINWKKSKGLAVNTPVQARNSLNFQVSDILGKLEKAERMQRVLKNELKRLDILIFDIKSEISNVYNKT